MSTSRFETKRKGRPEKRDDKIFISISDGSEETINKEEIRMMISDRGRSRDKVG